MMRGLALSYETLFTFNDSNGRFFDLPSANVAEGFFAIGRLLRGLGTRPTLRPVSGKLLEERGLYLSWLYKEQG